MPQKTHHTDATILLRDHYQRAGLDKGWSVKQIQHLCDMMRITPYELGALVAIPFPTMRQYLRKGLAPPWVALHFQIIQDCFLLNKTGMRSPPRVPLDLVVD